MDGWYGPEYYGGLALRGDLVTFCYVQPREDSFPAVFYAPTFKNEPEAMLKHIGIINLVGIAMDRWQCGTQTIRALKPIGVEIIPISTGFNTLSPIIKHLRHLMPGHVHLSLSEFQADEAGTSSLRAN